MRLTLAEYTRLQDTTAQAQATRAFSQLEILIQR